MNWLNRKRNHDIPIGFYDERTSKKDDIFSRIINEILLSRQEYYKNILYKFDSGEIDLLYEGKGRKGIIMGGSSSGNVIIGILREE